MARILPFVAALAALVGCAVDTCQLDRVGDPLSFAEVRDTAAWVPDFDSAWWSEIDAAYTQYDARLARVANESWEPLVASLVDSEQTGFPKDARGARAMWQRHLAVQAALGSAEMAFVAELDERLPAEADRFIALLRSRAAFWRASSQWAPHGQRLPGPLETLGIEGLRTPDAAIVEAATGAYARLAPVAQSAASARFKAYLEYCDEIGEAEAEVIAAAAALQAAEGEATEAASSRKEDADLAVQAAERRLTEHARRAADERVRVALFAENRGFGAAIANAERRDDFLERNDVMLHQGLRGRAGVRATRALALRLLERNHPGDELRKTAVEQAFAAYDESLAVQRARLASASMAERKAAYAAVLALQEPLSKVLRAQIAGVEPAAIELMALGVLLGKFEPDAAADELLHPKQETPASADELGEDERLRDKGLRVVTGFPLSPRVIRALADALRLEGEVLAEFESLAAAERRSALERTTEQIEAMRGAFGESDGEKGRLTVDERVRRALRVTRVSAAQIRALDREANARVLAAAAALAGVDARDPRIAAAQLELDLFTAIGVSTRMPEALAIGGLPCEATVSPLDIARSMDASDEVRETAEAIVLSRAEELRAAHADALEGVLRSVESFLRHILTRTEEPSRAAEAWYAPPSGASAVALRFALADEIGGALGNKAREAYLARFRTLAQPGMDPEQPPAIALLRVFAERADDRDAAADERDARLLVALELTQLDEARAEAARALHEWRASWIRAADMGSAGAWDDLARRGAVGSVLRQRVRDADERAIARCEARIAEELGRARALEVLGRHAPRIPVQFAPYFAE